MSDNTSPDDSLSNRISSSRRSFLAAVGGVSGAAGLAASTTDTSDENEALSAGGMATNITSQKRRNSYVTANPGSFDANELKSHELYWLTNGEFGVYNGTSTEQLPMGSPDKPVPAVNTERADIAEHTSTVNLSTREALRWPTGDNYEFSAYLTPTFQLINVQDSVTSHETFTRVNDIIQLDENGQLSTVATNDSANNGRLQMAAFSKFGHWLTIAGDSGPYYDARYFASAGDIDTNTIQGTGSPFSTVLPLMSGVTAYHDTSASYPNAHGLLWAEYSSEPRSSSTVTDVRIIKTATDGSYSVPLTLDRSTESFHFHSLDPDPFNDGDFYATTGDEGSEVQWYKSTDHGDTWSQISAAGGDQRYRTLAINFDANYAYWATDGWVNDGTGNEDGEAHFYRAPRNDLGNPEDLGVIANEPRLSYGTVKVHDPHGVLITVRDDNGTDYGLEKVPMWFWDIEAEKLRHVKDFSVDESLASRPGVSKAFKYQNSMLGDVFMRVEGWDTPLSDNSFRTSGFRVSKAQHSI